MLWAVVMLSAVGSSMIAAGRNDVALASNLRAAAIATAAADGAIQQAAFHLLPCTDQPGCAPWPANGTPVDASRDGIAIAICLVDQSGKINPNEAPPTLLAALLAGIDIPATDAARLADAIVAWRTPDPTPAAINLYRQAGLPYAPDGQKFTAVDDMRFVLGMTPAILDRLRPDLSLWGPADPDPALASPLARLALKTRLAADPATLQSFAIAGAQPRAVAITATAIIPRGAQFTRAAIVSLERDPARAPLRILSWTAAPDAPCAAPPPI